MKRVAVLCEILCLAVTAFAGFKVKLVKPKKPEQYEARATSAGVTYAADLLLDGGEQKDYFYKELTPSNIIAVRLAVFNSSRNAVTLPLYTLKLVDPDGRELPLVAPEIVARAVLQGMVVSAEPKQAGPVKVTPSNRPGLPPVDRTDPRYDPRKDPNDPRYDPRLDPGDPRYNPRIDPSSPGYDPRMDPNDPRNDPTNPYPGRTGVPGQQPYPGGTWGRPGVDVVLNPGGGGVGDLSQYERALVEKDFDDKAHPAEPVLPSLSRDKFLYFLIPNRPANLKGFTLRLPAGKGMPEEVILKF